MGLFLWVVFLWSFTGLSVDFKPGEKHIKLTLQEVDFMYKYYNPNPAGRVRLDSGSVFSDMIRGRDTTKVLRVMDELMETLELVAPRLYEITLNKLRETG